MVGDTSRGWRPAAPGTGPDGRPGEERSTPAAPGGSADAAPLTGGQVDHQLRRRRAAEAAATAEAAAADAATRASAAIADAARAAAAAEAAADAATRAAEELEAATAEERRAMARSRAPVAPTLDGPTTVRPTAGPIGGRRPGDRPNAAGPDQVWPVQVGPGPAGPGQPGPWPGPAGAGIPDPRGPVPAGRGPGDHDDPAAVTTAIPTQPADDQPSRNRGREAAAAAAREATRDPVTEAFHQEQERDRDRNGRDRSNGADVRNGDRARSGDGDRSRGDRARGDRDGRAEEAAPIDVERVTHRSRRMPVAQSRNPVTRLVRAVRAGVGRRALVVGGVVLAVIAVAVVLALAFGGASRTPAAQPDVAGPRSPAALPEASSSGVDPTSPNAVAFLEALRGAEVPTSDSGQAETEAAAVVCEQLGKGTDANDVVRSLPAVLPTVNATQAESVVAIAQKVYCR